MILTSFLDLAGREGGGGTLLIVTETGFAKSFLLLEFCKIVLGVNFEATLALRVLDLLSVKRTSYLAS